ncbi:MAG: aminotransferase class III-fold pyridoxal phosphate-dependent enzyme, partial [Bacteroidota bacterium]
QCLYKPDIMCLSKGLTGGFLPLAVTASTEAIYEAFLSDDKSKMLFHGHSFTANPIGCAASVASMDLFAQEATVSRIRRLCAVQEAAIARFENISSVTNVRVTGTIIAMDLRTDGATGYLNHAGKAIAEYMLENGVLMRPLGNVLYIMPPYTIEMEALERIYELLESKLKELERTAV